MFDGPAAVQRAVAAAQQIHPCLGRSGGPAIMSPTLSSGDTLPGKASALRPGVAPPGVVSGVSRGYDWRVTLHGGRVCWWWLRR